MSWTPFLPRGGVCVAVLSVVAATLMSGCGAGELGSAGEAAPDAVATLDPTVGLSEKDAQELLKTPGMTLTGDGGLIYSALGIADDEFQDESSPKLITTDAYSAESSVIGKAAAGVTWQAIPAGFWHYKPQRSMGAVTQEAKTRFEPIFGCSDLYPCGPWNTEVITNGNGVLVGPRHVLVYRPSWREIPSGGYIEPWNPGAGRREVQGLSNFFHMPGIPARSGVQGRQAAKYKAVGFTDIGPWRVLLLDRLVPGAPIQSIYAASNAVLFGTARAPGQVVGYAYNRLGGSMYFVKGPTRKDPGLGAGGFYSFDAGDAIGHYDWVGSMPLHMNINGSALLIGFTEGSALADSRRLLSGEVFSIAKYVRGNP